MRRCRRMRQRAHSSFCKGPTGSDPVVAIGALGRRRRRGRCRGGCRRRGSRWTRRRRRTRGARGRPARGSRTRRGCIWLVDLGGRGRLGGLDAGLGLAAAAGRRRMIRRVGFGRMRRLVGARSHAGVWLTAAFGGRLRRGRVSIVVVVGRVVPDDPEGADAERHQHHDREQHPPHPRLLGQEGSVRAADAKVTLGARHRVPAGFDGSGLHVAEPTRRRQALARGRCRTSGWSACGHDGRHAAHGRRGRTLRGRARSPHGRRSRFGFGESGLEPRAWGRHAQPNQRAMAVWIHGIVRRF